MKVTLVKEEIAEAVECYLARQGMATESFDLDVKIIISRSSEDSKLEVEMSKKDTSNDVPSEPVVREAEPELPFGASE